MNSRRDDELNHSTARTLAATLGAIPVALGVGIALTLALPLSANLRLTIGSYAVFPSWIVASCCTFLATNARRAWLSLFALLALSALISMAALALRAPATWAR
ncbi:MAG: hypothetical protein ABW061_06500 [Polyangiaceae bacterium]